MATQVPFNPVPQVAAQDRPTPYRSLDVPAAAFGAATAAATQHMGSTLQGVGNEIFGRAVQIQEMNEQASANEALTKFQDQQLAKFVEFQNTYGKDAYNRLPQFESEMEALRSQVRGTLGSPYAQKLYDAESRNSQWRMKLSAGFHAATQMQQYSVGALEAKRESNNNAALATPLDTVGFDQWLKSNEESTREIAKQKGWSPEKTELEVANAKNDLARSQVQGLMRTEERASSAKKLLEKYIKDKTITGDTSALQAQIDSKIRTVESRVVAGRINSGQEGWGYDGKVMGLDAAATIIRGGEGTDRWIGRHAQAPNGGTALGGYGIMNYNLHPEDYPNIKGKPAVGWLKQAGMPDMTEDEFIADHDAQTKLFKFMFGKYQQETGSFEGALRKWFGTGPGDGYHTWEQYRDMTRQRIANGASMAEKEQVSRDYARKNYPGDPLVEENIVTKVTTDTAAEQRRVLMDQHAAMDGLKEAAGPTPDGKLPVSVDAALANPKIKDLYEKAGSKGQDQFRKMIAANAKAGGFVMTPEKEDKFNAFMGTAYSRGLSPEDMDTLQKYDIDADQMPTAQRNAMRQVQATLMQGQAPPDDKLMKFALRELEHAGVIKDIGYRESTATRKQSEDSAMFRGALHDLIDDYIKTQRQPPDRDTIIEMGKKLVEERTNTLIGEPGSFWSLSDENHWLGWQRRYQEDIPKESADIITRNWQRTHFGAMPTPRQIHDTYISAQYSDLFSKRTPEQTPIEKYMGRRLRSQAPNLQFDPGHITNE